VSPQHPPRTSSVGDEPLLPFYVRRLALEEEAVSQSRHINPFVTVHQDATHHNVVDEWAAPTLTVSYPHFPAPLEGPEAFAEMLAQTHHFFPDLRIEVHDVIADGHRAVVRWTYRGTFQHGEMFGVEADGQPIEVSGITTYTIEAEQVVREEGIVDNRGLMQQLGALPDAA